MLNARLHTHPCAVRYVVAQGFCGAPEETWDYVKYLDEISVVNPLPRAGREMLYDLYKSWGSPRRFENVAKLRKCAAGTRG
eukprot:Skav218728  [mRNA]  locus=scaffold1346:817073:817574:+ [translate_table: standard]